VECATFSKSGNPLIGTQVDPNDSPFAKQIFFSSESSTHTTTAFGHIPAAMKGLEHHSSALALFALASTVPQRKPTLIESTAG
jgi:hypothetical protein